MKNIAIIILVLTIGANAENKSIESIKNTDIRFVVKSDVKLPKVSIKKENTQQQDVVYKFNQVKDDLWRLKSDTTELRSDIQRLELDARQIQQTGRRNYWFNYWFLTNMNNRMSRLYNDIQRISDNLKDILNIAYKDKDLNEIASDIDRYVRDIENTFRFDVENAAQNLENTVRSINPKLVGYDAQLNAMNISRYARDISYKARDMYGDASDLLKKTQP